jgi:hypothetical protein
MTNIRKTIRTIILLPILALGGCFQNIDTNGNPGIFTPHPLFLSNLPRGNDSFSKGFRQGCYNFIGQTGYGMMRMFDAPIDPNMEATDYLYWDGYSNGDRYCSVYVNKDINL